MKKNKIDKVPRKPLIILGVLIMISLIASFLIKAPAKTETIKEVMRDAVLHVDNRISFLGVMEVNPAVVSAFLVTAILLTAALLMRIFVIPKFKFVPGKLQLILETIVGYFKNLSVQQSPDKNKLLGAYIFSAGIYIFFSTLFELFGIQVVTTKGVSVSLPAPIADINAAISLGVLSYAFILFGGLFTNGYRGALHALKDFSLPISMSFRLFGALLSGLLVNELVYYSISLSYVLPVIVAVLFTLIHAAVQAYVLTMLTAVFYGEAAAKQIKPKTKKNKKIAESSAS